MCGFRPLRFYISFRSQHKIEFRDCADISTVLDTYSTLSLPPGPLFKFTTSSSTLLFADLSTELIGVHRLDCSGSKPRLVGRKIDVPLKWKYNMCYASGRWKISTRCSLSPCSVRIQHPAEQSGVENRCY